MLAVLVENGETLTQARENSRIDKEVTGARAFEVLEDGLGRVVGINRIPTNTLLLTRLERDPIEVPVYNAATRGFVTQRRRFRRFCQRDAFGRMVYFKELGDPRPIDPQTGRVNEDLPLEDQATSIYYDAYYTPGTPYGTPQWASCIPSMLGSREAEMVNLSFFRDNGIPAMAVLVSGGALTEESFNKIESYFTDVRGAENHNRIVVLEATPDVSEAAGVDGSIPAPRVDIKPMLSDRQHEGLFGAYIDASSEKIRQAFRLPPIYIGSAEEYNRASAFASIQTAEQQVFVPERLSWDRFMNDVVLSAWNFRFWRVASAMPTYNDPQEVTQFLTVLGKEGALTPNICIAMANRYLRTDIETVTDDWGDMPFAVTAAAIAAGRKVDGFEYVFEILEGLANTPNPNAPGEGEDDESGDGDTATANSLRKGLRLLLDELAETGSRELQALNAA
jgi:PBSX family phage portal protein